jgi:magnesium-transporting ATPase (P-type)
MVISALVIIATIIWLVVIIIISRFTVIGPGSPITFLKIGGISRWFDLFVPLWLGILAPIYRVLIDTPQRYEISETPPSEENMNRGLMIDFFCFVVLAAGIFWGLLWAIFVGVIFIIFLLLRRPLC